MKKLLEPTMAGWTLFFSGYLVVLIVDLSTGLSFEAFRAVVLTLAAPSLWLLYKGSRGKGSMGLRLLLVITQFWIAYALAALAFLITSP